MFCNWSQIRLRAFHLPAPCLWSAWLILFSWIWSFVWACADTQLWEGRSIWHSSAAKKWSCRKGEYWKEFSTLQVQHFIFSSSFHFTFSLCSKKKDGFIQLRTSVSMFDYYIMLYICVRVNMILDAMLLDCTKGFAIFRANLLGNELFKPDKKKEES